MTVSAYPLTWPKGRKRTRATDRKRARFSKGERRYTNNGQSSYVARADLSVADAMKRLRQELMTIGADWATTVVSTNLETRLDGLPRSGQRVPDDPGVCVYFNLGGKARAMPCDTYDTVEGNLAAIAAHIEATRAIERHGVATVAEMFEGFTALPPPATSPRLKPWWEVLRVRADATRLMIDYAYKELAKSCHPDVAGGSTEAMAELNRARDDAMKAVCT